MSHHKEGIEKEMRGVGQAVGRQAANRKGTYNKYFSGMKTPPIIRRYFKEGESVIPADIDISVAEFKDELNQEVWNGEKLKPEIRYNLLKIVKKFYEFLNLEVPVKDIIFTGSLANYNWHPESDVDLHLILNTEALGLPLELVEEYLIAKKTIWNDRHDIKIKGFEVELYAKDEEAIRPYKGIYSVARDKWIQEPKEYKFEIDEEAIKEKAAFLMKQIEDIEKITDRDDQLELADKVMQKIKKLRKIGLGEFGAGEFSNENLAFKALRRNGYLDRLSVLKRDSYDKAMSIDEMLTETAEDRPHSYGCLMLEYPIQNWDKVGKFIDTNDLYKDQDGFVKKTNPHVIVLHGFHDDVNLDSIQEALYQTNPTAAPIEIHVDDVSCFEGKDYDVVKFSVISPQLTELNEALAKLPHTSDFPEYKPHITLAYVKPGKGKKYAKKLKNGMKFNSNNFKFKSANGDKKTFKMSRPRNQIHVEDGIETLTPEKLEMIQKFVNFVANKLELEKGVVLYLHKGRDEYIETTASYAPGENSNHVKIDGRALVDVLRSIGHELTHNRQREIGSFDAGDAVQNIGGWIEDEANAKAGIMIKDFAKNYGNDLIYEL